MSTSRMPDSVAGGRVAVAASRLWAGGVATAFVAALVAAVGVLLFSSVMNIKLVRLPVLLPITDSLALNYAATAFVFALAATGLAHLLTVITPRPSVFFGWIVGLVTVAHDGDAVRVRCQHGQQGEHRTDQHDHRDCDRKPALCSSCPYGSRQCRTVEAMTPRLRHG